MEALNKFNPSEIRKMIIFILFLLWTFYSWTACGQLPNRNKTAYKGIGVSFGARSFQLTSDIAELNDINVLEEGGQLFMIFGTENLRTKLGLAGLYYSDNSVKRSIDMFETDLMFNFFPIGSGNIVNPYLTGGVIYDRLKFSGYYLTEDKATINYSTSKEPVLGTINQISASAGLGFEISLMENEFEFFRLFTEAKFGSPVTQKASQAFANTRASNAMLVSIGFRFGSKN